MSELKTSVLIVQENVLYSGEIYFVSNNFTLLPGVTAGTNLMSAPAVPIIQNK